MSTGVWGPIKPIGAGHHAQHQQLRKTLSWPHLIALGVGAIVGTGIYTLEDSSPGQTYTLALRDRPLVPGAIFFGVMALISAAASVPPVIYEVMAGNALWPTPKGWLIVLFIAIFPSFLSQIFFMRGVELIGPARAGIFINLVPIFGAILAVLILSEPFHLYHALALGLVFTGIWLSERRKAPEAASASGEG